jgi:hypothetical protein
MIRVSDDPDHPHVQHVRLESVDLVDQFRYGAEQRNLIGRTGE